MRPDPLRRRPSPDASERGATLIELVIGFVIIGLSLAGTLEVMRRTTWGSADPMLIRQATAVAESYLEEILLRPYYDPDLGSGGGVCPAAEGSRSLYDNVCDYDGVDDAPPRDQTGTVVTGLAAYRARVAVDASATANLGALAGGAANQVVRVDVRITHSDQVDFTLSGYRANY